MIPIKTVNDLINRHALLEKELSSAKIDKNSFAEKSKEYADLNEIIKIAKFYISFEKNKKEIQTILEDKNSDTDMINMAEIELNNLEIENPKLANQIKSLNKDLENISIIKADLAMATAKNIGLNVNEKTLQTVESLDGKVIIALDGTSLVKVVDEKMLKEQAANFVDPISKFSINKKIYTTDALKPELLTNELTADTYNQAKAVREKAVERVRALESSPDVSSSELQAAKAASQAAKYAEIAAGQSLISSNSNITSVAIQEKNLEALRQVASTPGMNKFDVRRANAAVKAAEAKIAGINYDYKSAISKIAMDENKFNSFRVNLYNKDIEAAKLAGNLHEANELQKDLLRFQERLVDERKAFEAATARSDYFKAISDIVSKNSLSISSSSIQNATSQVTQTQDTAISAAEANVGSNQVSAYKAAKEAREQIDKNMNELRASGASKEVLQAAEDARHAALQAEIAAANVVSANSTAVKSAVEAATAAAQEAAQDVAQVAQAAAQEAAQSAAQSALDTLKEVANTPGMSQWDVQRAQAAVKAAEAEMAGTEYDLEHALNTINQNKAYEEAGGTPNQSGRTWDGH